MLQSAVLYHMLCQHFTRKNCIEKIQQKNIYNIVITEVLEMGVYNYNNSINNESLEKFIIVIGNN